jgi:cytochrome c1
MQTVGDLVNFLYYIGEPIRAKRQSIGVWVLAFLGTTLHTRVLHEP